MIRTQFHWSVPLQADNGQNLDFPVSAFWSPEKDNTKEFIAGTARAMAVYQSGNKVGFAVVGEPQLVGEQTVDQSGGPSPVAEGAEFPDFKQTG